MGKPKFHLQITAIDTGEVLHECDTSCIIGAADKNGSTDRFCIAVADSLSLGATIAGAQDVILRAMEKLPKTVREAVEATILERAHT